MEYNPLVVQTEEVLVRDRGTAVGAVNRTAKELLCIGYRE